MEAQERWAWQDQTCDCAPMSFHNCQRLQRKRVNVNFGPGRNDTCKREADGRGKRGEKKIPEPSCFFVQVNLGKTEKNENLLHVVPQLVVWKIKLDRVRGCEDEKEVRLRSVNGR